ncbi:MAG TPA: GTPase ObgE [Candidatus Limnocylindrales bacterium]|jgi:GTP-binding protein|nr:GTPase ObgE [Candidatus Limnocylindrales bacterium]
MFIDQAIIKVKAGDGGNGCMAFRREKFVPRGGPSGGDGGRGGDIIMESSERHNTLVHFRFNPEYKAQRGRHGEGSNCTGRDGESIVLKVPVGTMVYDNATGEKLHDFSHPDERITIAQGGRGGRGNQHFATSTHQAPTEHEPGKPGDERTLRLELKLLADVGLVGYPNVGKSTLISRISAARPKIADYPFTTLQPNLGVVTIGEMPNEESYVVADIPGLIEGAHTGTGLGTQFLRHIERTRVLAHVVDVSDASGRPDPVKDFNVIMSELESFGAELEKKPMMVIASKIDVANPEKLEKLRKLAKKLRLDLYEISAVTGKGIPELKYGLGRRVAEIRSGNYEVRKPARKKAASSRKARKTETKRRIPKRAAFKKRKSR